MISILIESFPLFELFSKWIFSSGLFIFRFWDDWMRHPDQRRDRTCIRPEISRTSTFGRQGVSKLVTLCFLWNLLLYFWEISFILLYYFIVINLCYDY